MKFKKYQNNPVEILPTQNLIKFLFWIAKKETKESNECSDKDASLSYWEIVYSILLVGSKKTIYFFPKIMAQTTVLICYINKRINNPQK